MEFYIILWNFIGNVFKERQDELQRRLLVVEMLSYEENDKQLLEELENSMKKQLPKVEISELKKILDL